MIDSTMNVTNDFDWDNWKEAFGNTFLVPGAGGGGELVVNAVPEPSAAVLALIGLVALCGRRRF
jgi:MYXO-CTERM domain-containing protein